MMARRAVVDKSRTMRRNNVEGTFLCDEKWKIVHTWDYSARKESTTQSVIVQRCSETFSTLHREQLKLQWIFFVSGVENFCFLSHGETDFARQHFFTTANKSKVGGNFVLFFFRTNVFSTFYHCLCFGDKECGRTNDHFFHSFSNNWGVFGSLLYEVIGVNACVNVVLNGRNCLLFTVSRKVA